jgi:hypothetical protein
MMTEHQTSWPHIAAMKAVVDAAVRRAEVRRQAEAAGLRDRQFRAAEAAYRALEQREEA